MNILDLLTKNEKTLLKYEEYKENSYLFYQDEKCTKIGIIIKGSIKIAAYSTLGNELIFNVLHINQIFGNNLLFSSNPFYKGDVIALEDCLIAYLDKNDLLKILNQNKEFLLNYLKIQSDFGKELNSKIKLLSLNGATERLVFFLEENDGQYEYKTINDLANLLNLQRETLSRTISLLIKKKIIQRKNKTLILI